MTIDPSRVPAFPVYTLQIGADHTIVTLDGATVPVGSQTELATAGTTAVLAKMHRQHLDVVRVTAIDTTTRDSWEMIIASDGEILDLTPAREAAATQQDRRRTTRRRLLIAGTCTLALMLGIVTTAVLITGQPSTPAPAYTPEGAGATLPAAPPPSHAPTATWSQPVATGSTITLITDELLLSANPDGSMSTRNPATGQALWRGSRAPTDVRTVHPSSWAGKSVFAAVTGRELLLWPTLLPEGTSSVTPTAIPLETGQSARVDVGTPYIDLGDWYIKLPDTAGKMHEMMIPPGSAVLTTTGDGDIITASHDTIYTLDNHGTITDQVPYTAPSDTSGHPTRVWTLDEQNLLLAWGAGTPVLAVLNLNMPNSDLPKLDTAQITFTGTTRSMPGDHAILLVDDQARTAVLGSTGLRYGTNPGLIDLGSSRVSALHGTTAFTTTNTGPATLDLTQDKPEPVAWEPYGPDDPAPVLVTDDAAYLIATQLERTVLYRSDRQR